MALRKTEGSVVCPSCGSLVGVNDATCYNCGRRNPGMWGYAPLLRALGQDLGFGPLILGVCGTMFVLSLLLSGGDYAEEGFSPLLAPSGRALFLLGSSGAVPVFGAGRWWTIFSAGWLHANILHIVMNMLGARQLAPLVADIFGPGRAIVIYVLSGACGFLLSTFGIFIPLPFLRGAGFTVGASAPLCGMLGALMAYSRMGGSSMLGAQVKSWILSMAIFGLLFPGIDNYAHLGGFLGGYVIARWMNPFKPERLDHLLWGLLCLLLTFLAILASVLYGLPLVRPTE